MIQADRRCQDKRQLGLDTEEPGRGDEDSTKLNSVADKKKV